MATQKKGKQPVRKSAAGARPSAARSKSAKTVKPAPAAKKTQAVRAKEPKKESKVEKTPAASSKKGLVVFSVVLGMVILLAVVSKFRQGPAVKLLPVQVQMIYSLPAEQTPALNLPRGIAVDPAGGVYVADLGNNRVIKFKPDGTLDFTWGAAGQAEGQFKEPSGVAVDNQGSVFVADAWNGRIQKFNAQGEYLGEIGSQAGNFYSPRNVAVDGHGFIYVSDTGNSCVKKFDVDGNLVKRWGEFGPGRERFQETFGIWVDTKNQVYVGDAGNRRLKIFTADGKYLREIRVKGWRSGNSWPMAAVDAAGRVYAVDTQNSMIWIYDAAGKYLGSWGNQPGKDIFAAPLGIAVDASGAVYVANSSRGQILKLAPPNK